MRLPKSMLVVLTVVFAISVFTIAATGKKASATDSDAVAAITQMVNATATMRR